MKIYLAGFINGSKLDQCAEWRRRVREYYYSNPKWHNEIVFLDPLNGKQFENITPDGLGSDIPGKALVHRDFKCVKECDLLVANLNTFGVDRTPTGTLFEVAWGWTMEKPVIIITDDARYINHPFIKDTASIIVPSVDDMLEKRYIDYFYKGTVTALY